MILGKITDIAQRADLPAALRAIVKQALALAPETLEPGRYEIDGNDIFINVMAFETADAQSKRYEQHRDYADIQILLSGNERIDFGPANSGCFSPVNRISQDASQTNRRRLKKR